MSNIEAMAHAVYQSGKDNALAGQYEATAKDVLRSWRNKVAKGVNSYIYHRKPEGERRTR